jgi:hypothetical protein
VAVAPARSVRLARARGALGARSALGAWHVLGLIVGASFLLRAVVGWLRATPTFFPDEYLYAELARSLAETGRPLVRGAGAHFPALLQPFLTAPAWLVEDVETSFRLVQLLGACAMSLAAVPVFLLGRRLGLGERIALALAGLSLALPDLLYSSWVTAEPFAYPLALAAVLAGTAVLTRPSLRLQLTFAALMALAIFARVQFVVIPVCFLVALAAVGLRERRLRASCREQLPLLGLFLLPLALLAAAGPGRALGYYRDILDSPVDAPSFAKWTAADGLMLVFASGWVLVPGALLGAYLALRRPRSRAELAFGAFAPALVLALLAEAGFYSASVGDRIQERYFFYAIPLVGLLFALYASRGWPHKLAHGLLAAGLVTAAARIPLSGYSAADRKTGSPTLYALARLESLLGDPGLAALAAAGLVALLSLAALAAAARSRRPTAVVLGLALGTCLAASAGAAVFGHENAGRVRAQLLPADPSWVDSTGVEKVALLQAPFASKGAVQEQLFWNRSLDSLLLLPDAVAPDTFAATRVSLGPDGTLLAGGRPLTGALLVDEYGATSRLRVARELARSEVFRLLRPQGPARLELYMPGRYFDGWLALQGSIRLWPDSPGTLGFTLSLPPSADPATVTFTSPGQEPRTIDVAPGRAQRVSLAVCSRGAWRAGFQATFTGSVGDRFVSVRASQPVFRADRDACPYTY